jgi:hypothetical protein
LFKASRHPLSKEEMRMNTLIDQTSGVDPDQVFEHEIEIIEVGIPLGHGYAAEDDPLIGEFSRLLFATTDWTSNRL